MTICFDCDRRITRRGRKWVTTIGRELICAGTGKAHRTTEAAAAAERRAAR